MKRRALIAGLAAVLFLGLAVRPAEAQQQPGGAQPEIIGGSIAPANSNKFVVALIQRRFADPNQGQFCGGTLVSPDTVLTAAHCVRGQTANTVDVLGGTVDLSAGGQRVHVRQIRIDPRYSPTNGRYDVAIVQLATPLPLPLSVPNFVDGASDGNADPTVLAGWGATSNTPTFPSRLRQATLPVRPASVCGALIGTGFGPNEQLCVGGGTGTPAPCYGDSGGPLYSIEDDGTALQFGIASFNLTARCGEASLPTVFSRLDASEAFIGPYLDPDTAPGQPATIATTRLPGGVRVAWTPPTFDGGSAVTGYRITVQPGGQVFTTVRTARSRDITGLVTDQQYTFSVQAVNGFGPGTPRSTTRRAG